MAWLLDLGQFVFCCCSFLAFLSSEVSWPWFPLRLSFFFLSLFCHYIVDQQCPIPSIWYSVSALFLTLCRSLFMQSTIAIAVFLTPFPFHILGICSLCQIPISHSFHMTGLCQLNTVLLKIVLQSDTHSQFIHILLSTVLTPAIPITRLFSQTWTFSCCFSVSAIVY